MLRWAGGDDYEKNIKASEVYGWEVPSHGEEFRDQARQRPKAIDLCNSARSRAKARFRGFEQSYATHCSGIVCSVHQGKTA